MTHLSSPAPVGTAPRCEGCGYLLTGLPAAGHCPECGRTFARGVSGRRPAPFEVRPTFGVLARTAAAVLFRPGRFFGALSARPVGSRAAWFARCHRFVAAAFLAVAVSGHLLVHTDFKLWLRNAMTPAGGVPSYDQFTINLGFTRVYWIDEPTLFGLLLAPLALAFYAAIALLTRAAARVTPRLTGPGEVPAARAVVVRALRFHTVHWAVVAFAAAVTVGGPWSLALTPLAAAFYLPVAGVTAFIASRSASRLESPGPAPRFRAARFLAGTILILATAAYYLPRFESPDFDHLAIPPADPRPYRVALAVEALLFPTYLVLTGWRAVMGMMYANEEMREAAPSLAS